MEIKAYGLYKHPDISSFYEDYDVDDADTMFEHIDELAVHVGGVAFVPWERDIRGERVVELHVLCDTEDERTISKAVVMYMAAKM